MSAVNALALLAAAGGDYQISRSVRLRSSASAYFNRTFGTPTSGNIFTWSGWVKRGAIGAVQPLFTPSYAGGEGAVFNASNQISIAVNGALLLVSTAVYRDPSAWYHIMLVSDMGNATASLRFRVYVNGVEVTAWGTDARASYSSFPYWNKNTVVHYMGYSNAYPAYGDGYLTEINFIDGQALTPSSFGETDSVSGVWKPKKYAGTYGTNGFYLNFSDNSSNTATTIGKDYSGNGNNWTPNNISVTSGVTYDSMIDTPTPYADGGNGRGNYAVINPLAAGSDATITNGNLSIAYGTSATISTTLGSFGMSYGKWYWENTMTASSLSASTAFIGLVNQSNPTGAGAYPGATSRGWSYYSNLGHFYNNGSAIQTGLASFGTNDVIGVAFDADAGTLKFYKNNTQIGTTITGIPADTYYAAWSDGSVANTFTIAANFGQRPFAYTPPSGFVALNTQNLQAPTIANGANYMAASTYTGNGSTLTVTNGGNNTLGTTFKPDFVWIKDRTGANNHCLFDSVRGVYILLNSNATAADQTFSTSLTSFNSNGFSLGSYGNVNLNSSSNYIAWQWQAGQGTTSNITVGQYSTSPTNVPSIASTVSVNATAGFSIVTYTGTGANATVGHGLGVAPNLIILKPRNSADNWPVWHGSFAVNEYVYLNSTNAKTSLSTFMNGTLPNSTVISLGTWANTNTNGTTMVAYCWAAVAGYSAFGSYTGNGSADGPFVYTGFRPRWVMIKCSSASATSWVILDTSRDTYNAETNGLLANVSDAESSGYLFDGLSNGFKVRNTGSGQNTNGATYIYAAFAENPFKNSLAR